MLIDDVKIVTAITPTAGAAGTSTLTSAAIDLAGFTGCCFVVPIGAIVGGAATSIKAQQSSDDAASDAYSDILGTSQTIADTESNTVRYLDIVRPEKRYLKLIVSRATQAATVGGAVALLYGARRLPVTHGAGVTGEQFSLPIEGTA